MAGDQRPNYEELRVYTDRIFPDEALYPLTPRIVRPYMLAKLAAQAPSRAYMGNVAQVVIPIDAGATVTLANYEVAPLVHPEFVADLVAGTFTMTQTCAISVTFQATCRLTTADHMVCAVYENGVESTFWRAGFNGRGNMNEFPVSIPFSDIELEQGNMLDIRFRNLGNTASLTIDTCVFKVSMLDLRFGINPTPLVFGAR